MASVGALRTSGAPAPLTLGVRPMRNTLHAQAIRAASSAAAEQLFWPPSLGDAALATQVQRTLN